MNLSRKIAHNTIIQMVGKIISTVLGLFSLALITRYLGQTGFGEYTTIITFLTIFAVIADFGITLVTVQMISCVDDKKREEKILNNLFSFRLISVIAFLALSPLVLLFMPYGAAIKTGILITALYFVFPALSQVVIGLLQKRLSMDRAALAEVLSRLVLIIGILIVWFCHLGLNGILIATVISGASSFIFHYLFALKFVTIKCGWDTSLFKEIFHRSWPLAITIVLNLIYLRTDIIFLSLFKGEAEVGLYGAAYKVVDVLTTLPFLFAGLILPILTASWLENKTAYFKVVLQKSFDFMAILAIPLIVGGQLLAGPVMTAVAGKDFSESGAILKLLIIAVAAIFLGTMFSHAVIALDKQKKLIVFYAFTSISSLIAYFILIPRFSYFGAAAVTIYSEVMIAIFSAYCVFKYSRFVPKLQTVSKALVASALMGLIIMLFPKSWQLNVFGLITIIVVASTFYVLSLVLIGGIKLSDLQAMSKKSNGAEPFNSSNL
jgi:O-antigen/teichoic acid export membrane protein